MSDRVDKDRRRARELYEERAEEIDALSTDAQEAWRKIKAIAEELNAQTEAEGLMFEFDGKFELTFGTVFRNDPNGLRGRVLSRLKH